MWIFNDDGFFSTVVDAHDHSRLAVRSRDGNSLIHFLDSMEIDDIDMLKIDVEGLEMEVLRGASDKLEKIEYLMIELNNNSKRYGSNNIEIEEHLKSLGFKELIKTWPDIVYYKS